MYIETQRLIIRDFEMTDVDAYYNMVRNEELTYKAGFKPHPDKHTTEIFVKSITYNKDYLVISLKDGTFIGDINFYNDPLRPKLKAWQIGFILNKPYWHNGYMQEALRAFIPRLYKKFSPDIITCMTMTDNINSQKLIERLGFSFDGVFRNYKKMYDGKIIDCKMYTLKNNEVERKIIEWQKN